MNRLIEEYVTRITNTLSCSDKRRGEAAHKMREYLYEFVNKLILSGKIKDEEEATKLAIQEFGETKLNQEKFLEVVAPTLHRISQVLSWIALTIFSMVMLRNIVIPSISYRIQVFQRDALDPNSMYGFAQWKEKLQLIPFKTITTYILNWGQYNLETIVVLLMIPLIFFLLGIFLPPIAESCRSFKNILIITLMMSLMIEIIRFILQMGVTNIDHIILSLVAASLGYLGHMTYIHRLFRIFNIG